MKEIGEVVGIKDDTAILRFERNSACEKCGACSMAGQDNRMLLKVHNNLKANIGDLVEVDLEVSKFLQASGIVYLIPLLTLLIGMGIGYYLLPELGLQGNREIFSGLCGILLTVLSFMMIKRFEPLWQKENRFSPKMLRLITHRENQ
ncbi:MAG: SoxR reducing system RseC family protein [Clostridia bacterium]